jgi:hypothetical protein
MSALVAGFHRPAIRDLESSMTYSESWLMPVRRRSAPIGRQAAGTQGIGAQPLAGSCADLLREKSTKASAGTGGTKENKERLSWTRGG